MLASNSIRDHFGGPAVASLIGATFVFPGVSMLDGGTTLSKPPFLSGLGPVFLVWLTGPLMTLTLATTLFLILRTFLLRGEDPFHKVLWVRAFAAKHASCTVQMHVTMPAALCAGFQTRQLLCLWTLIACLWTRIAETQLPFDSAACPGFWLSKDATL